MNPGEELVFEVAYYYSEDRQKLTRETIQRTLLDIEGVQGERAESSREQVFRYYNRDTGVSCNFVMFPPPEEGEVGLAMEMMLPRPVYFALEALPMAVRVAREMRLMTAVVSPDGGEEPSFPTVEALMVRWQEANLEELGYLQQQGRQVYRMHADALENLWEYNLLRSDLVRRYGRQRVDVPPVEFWASPSSGHVVRAVEWRRLGPVAFPDVDWIRLKDPPGGLKQGKVIEAGELLDRAKFAFRDLAQPIFHHFHEKTSVLDDLIDLCQDLPGIDVSGYQRVAPEDVIDRHIVVLRD